MARKQRLEPQSVDLKVLISNIKELLQRTLGPTIDLEISSDPDLASAWVDSNQLELAILNLAINARAGALSCHCPRPCWSEPTIDDPLRQIRVGACSATLAPLVGLIRRHVLAADRSGDPPPPGSDLRWFH